MVFGPRRGPNTGFFQVARAQSSIPSLYFSPPSSVVLFSSRCFGPGLFLRTPVLPPRRGLPWRRVPFLVHSAFFNLVVHGALRTAQGVPAGHRCPLAFLFSLPAVALLGACPELAIIGQLFPSRPRLFLPRVMRFPLGHDQGPFFPCTAFPCCPCSRPKLSGVFPPADVLVFLVTTLLPPSGSRLLSPLTGIR